MATTSMDFKYTSGFWCGSLTEGGGTFCVLVHNGRRTVGNKDLSKLNCFTDLGLSQSRENTNRIKVAPKELVLWE